MKLSFVISASLVAGLAAAQFATVTTPEAAAASQVGVVLELRDDSSTSSSQKATTTQKTTTSAKATTTSSSSQKKTTDSDSEKSSKTKTSSKSTAKTTANTASTTSKNNGGGGAGASSTTATTSADNNAGASASASASATSQDTGVASTTSSNPTSLSTDGTSTGAASSTGISAGAAAGIAIGAVVGVAALAGAAFLLWRRRAGGIRGAVVTGSFPPDMGPGPTSPGASSGMGGGRHGGMTSISDSVAGSGLGSRPSPSLGPSHSPAGSYSNKSYSAVGSASPTYPDPEAYPIMHNQQSPGFSGSSPVSRLGSDASIGAMAGAAAVPRQTSYTAYRPDVSPGYSRLNQHDGDAELATRVPSAYDGVMSPRRSTSGFGDGSGHDLPAFMIPGGAHRVNSMSPPPVDRQHHQIPSIEIQTASPRTSKGPGELMGSPVSDRVELPG